MPARIFINKALFKQRLLNKSTPLLKSKLQRTILPIVENANRELLRQFLEHEISKEIKAGNTALNTSGTLGGYGNLFSFIGFTNGEDPIGELADFLSGSIDAKLTYLGKKTGIRITIRLPSKEDIAARTELPWSNKSWVFAIEKGLSGLGQYLYDEEDFQGEEYSESETAIQVTGKIRSNKFKNTKYMSEILNNIAKQLVFQIKKYSV